MTTHSEVAQSKPFFFYVAVFWISAFALALQILQARLLSVITWYHLAFLVISVAMFGFIVGALKVYRGEASYQRKHFHILCSRACVKCGISSIMVLFVQLRFPMVFPDLLYVYFFLPLIAMLMSIPYYYAGFILSISLTRSPYSSNIVYGVDLLGASTGCLLAFFLLNTIDTPSAFIVLASSAFLAAYFYERSSSHNQAIPWRIVFSMMLCVMVLSVNYVSDKRVLRPMTIKEEQSLSHQFEFNDWNAISYVTLSEERQDSEPFLWGPSPKLPKNYTASYKHLVIDGSASTPVTKFDPDQLSSLGYLNYDVTNLAYSLGGMNDALIIGVGGGRDVLSAKYFGVKRVTALDLNPIQIDLLTKNRNYVNYTNINKLQGVELLNYEARSWIRQNNGRYDLIQMSLVDTWAATASGAYSLSENGLYTVQAWSLFLSRLNKQGVFTASRWFYQYNISETARVLSLAMAALFEQNIREPRQHIVLAASKNIATLIISKSPLTSEQLDRLDKQIHEKGYITLVSPRKQDSIDRFKSLLQSRNIKELNLKVKESKVYDISPPTDMRPFFFNQLTLNPFVLFKILNNNHAGVFFGQARATLNLLIIIVLSMLMVAGIVFLSFTDTAKKLPMSLLLFGTSYFMLIGLGFMLIEIAFLQGFGLYLGHPSYGLSVVLFSLILSTGVGSLLSNRWPLSRLKSRLLWCLIICVYISLLASRLDQLFMAYAQISLFHRALLSVVVICPCGLLLGYGLPTGLRLVEIRDTDSNALFWAVNGAAGVLASALGVALNITFGLDITLMIGAACYFLLILPFFYFSLKYHQ